MQTSSEPIAEPPENPNDISMSDAETQSGNEHEASDNVNDNVHVDAQPCNDILHVFSIRVYCKHIT